MVIHGFLCTGTGRDRNPSRANVVAITGIHGVVCAGTGHHGNASRHNRPPWELVTTGIHGGGVNSVFSPERVYDRITPDVSGTFFCVFATINNQYVSMDCT